MRVCWGEERVYFLGEGGGLERLLVSWTNLAPAEPFVEASSGRSPFRVRDLLALSDLVASLEGGGR